VKKQFFLVALIGCALGAIIGAIQQVQAQTTPAVACAIYGNLNTTISAMPPAAGTPNADIITVLADVQSHWNQLEGLKSTWNSNITGNAWRGLGTQYYNALLMVYQQGSQFFVYISPEKEQTNTALTLPTDVITPQPVNYMVCDLSTLNTTGFEVLEAWYGDLCYNNISAGATDRQILNVTSQVQGMVANSLLTFPGGTKNTFFSDPTFGYVKGLLVFYRVGNQVFMQISGEYDAMTIGLNQPTGILIGSKS